MKRPDYTLQHILTLLILGAVGYKAAFSGDAPMPQSFNVTLTGLSVMLVAVSLANFRRRRQIRGYQAEMLAEARTRMNAELEGQDNANEASL